ncbi:unnamed protein product [Sphagnum jensenii]
MKAALTTRKLDMPSAEQQYGLGIAREFNVSSDSASFAQAFRNESTLQTYGQFNADWRNVPAPPDSSPAPTAQESDVHQVAAGETLWSIAQHDLGGDPSQTDIAQRVQQLATENKISDPNKIYVGQTINLDSASTEASQIPAPIVAPIPTSPVAPAAAPAAKQK